MKLKQFIVGGLLFTSIYGNSFAQESCLVDKQITLNQVKDVLKPIMGNVAKPISVSPSKIQGLYEVVLDINGKKIVAYIDCSLSYLITGEIVDIKNKKMITRERLAQLKKEDIKQISKELKNLLGSKKFQKLKNSVGENALINFSVVDLKNIPSKGKVIYGNKNSDFTIIVITDPECPFCKRLHNSIKQVLKDKDVKFELIMYPLPFHKYAEELSLSIVCQNSNEKSKQLVDEIFENQNNKEKLKEISEKYKCENGKEILKTHKEFAKSVKVNGTPTMIFVVSQRKGIKVSGAYPPQILSQIIDALK